VKFVNAEFVGETIEIDGHEFDGNRFVNCTLVYRGGRIQMRNNTFEGVRWHFDDAAARTVGLLRSFHQSGDDWRHVADIILGNTATRTGTP
jgi:hypothetical protein